MKRFVFRLLAPLFLACLMTPAIAASVVYDGGTGKAVGINDLDVNGSSLFVRFRAASFNDTFGAGLPFFWGNEADATSAALAIRDAMNAEAAVPIISDGTSEVLWVAYSEDLGGAQFRTKQVGHDLAANPWVIFPDFQGQKSIDFSSAPNSWLFAEFSTSPFPTVPVPASLPLLVLGLAGFGLMRRRFAE